MLGTNLFLDSKQKPELDLNLLFTTPTCYARLQVAPTDELQQERVKASIAVRRSSEPLSAQVAKVGDCIRQSLGAG